MFKSINKLFFNCVMDRYQILQCMYIENTQASMFAILFVIYVKAICFSEKLSL